MQPEGIYMYTVTIHYQLHSQTDLISNIQTRHDKKPRITPPTFTTSILQIFSQWI